MGAWSSSLFASTLPTTAATSATTNIVLPADMKGMGMSGAGSEPSGADVGLAVTHMNAFGLRLVHRLLFQFPPNTSAPEEVANIQRETAAPIVVSPVSVYLMLSMLSAGAASKTRDELAKLLLCPKDKSDADLARIYGAVIAALQSLDADAQLHFANAIFAAPSIKPSYTHLLTAFHAVAQPLTTSKAVNAWVQTATKGQISSILSGELPKATTAVVVSANAFHCDWTTPFDPKQTTEQKFFTSQLTATNSATATAAAGGGSNTKPVDSKADATDASSSAPPSFVGVL